MAAVLSFKMNLASATVLLALATANPVYLAPEQDIFLPSSDSASEPLKWLGANSPWFAGPDYNGESNDVPDGCTVEQVAYVVRHGSRYPDTGAYAEWTALQTKIQAANFTATGSMAFLKDWKPVLTNPSLQIAQESSTGYKEAYDLGYKLRTRYPKLYSYGSPFVSWANLYPRVVQTAQNFVRGFLGPSASTLGQVITVNSTGSPQALFDSLSPSDMCPNFKDGNGGTAATNWSSIYLPPITARLNALITGNLTLATTDVSIFPYLCGFESQITGALSPWCSVFTDEELRQYEYAQDLRYYYGIGDGVDLPSKMMLPFLNSLMGVIADGPGQNGTAKNGSAFVIPNILTTFVNDGQLTELVAATGVMSDQSPLDGTKIPGTWKYIASHFVSMRGTVAFERMSCKVPVTNGTTTANTRRYVTGEKWQGKGLNATHSGKPPGQYTNGTAIRTGSRSTPTSKPVSSSGSSKFSSTILSSGSGSDTGSKFQNRPGSSSESGSSGSNNGDGNSNSKLPEFGHSHSGSPISSSLLSPIPISFSTITVTAPVSISTVTSIPTSVLAQPTSTSTSSKSISTSSPTGQTTTKTYIRILLNDAVYPVPTCQDGPGKSCLLSDYVKYVGSKLTAAGDLRTRCNVSAVVLTANGGGNGTTVVNGTVGASGRGASFYKNLGESWLGSVVP
ncbi:histidine phosphatase superfamily [Tricladium varicosporioides]|nr:histidine phosphatase superfamily [Hymenoscyphus varicosporioides]